MIKFIKGYERHSYNSGQNGSSRLPGKVLMDICGKPMLMGNREDFKSRFIDNIIVCTSTSNLDDEIQVFCINNINVSEVQTRCTPKNIMRIEGK